jgi:hypothetical protein
MLDAHRILEELIFRAAHAVVHSLVPSALAEGASVARSHEHF